jgi:hypothetical protein
VTTPGWERPLEGASDEGHLVQVYADERFLLRGLALWVAHGLSEGGAAVVIATPAHRQALLEALGAAGEAVTDRLVLLDAEATLARLLRAGRPDPEAFAAVAREAVARARGGDPARAVRAWGEMVDLLWHRGQHAAARDLEDLWNGVVREASIRLLCAYRGDVFDLANYHGPLRDFAHGHGRLVTAEDPARFERAVDAALWEVCGAEGPVLRDLLDAREVAGFDLVTDPAQRLLLSMHHVVPEFGAKVIRAAGRHYRSDEAASFPPSFPARASG